MVRNYQKSKAKKAKEYARAHAQPITNMFARTAATAAPNATAENEVIETVDESNNNANAADDGGGDGDDGGDGSGDGGDDNRDDEGRWPPLVEKWVKRVKNEIDKSVKMTGRGDDRRPMGPFPDKYKGRVSPSDDPVSFFHGEAITEDHFALPDMVVWYPEGQYPSHICPRGRPPCKWHNEYACCVSKGWMDHGRRAYAMGRVFLVLGRRYECSVRKEEGKKCRFRNIDIEVINNSHDYIRLQWKKIGFDFSRRAGISNRDLELSRRCLVQGLSVSGFANVMGQASKRRHLIIAGQYRSYTHIYETFSAAMKSQEAALSIGVVHQ